MSAAGPASTPVTGGAEAPHPTANRLQPAPIGRRLLSMTYEAVLLFGLVVAVGMVYGIATHQTHGLKGRHGLDAMLFLAFGAYFVWFWINGGQTLAQKTWRIRVQTVAGRPLGPWRAFARFLAACAAFAAPLIVLEALGLTHEWLPYVVTPVLWGTGYVAMTRFHPRRQFLHDALCGTELVAVDLPPAQP